MMFRNQISLFLATLLIIGFFFLALPEKGYSQDSPNNLGCCIEMGVCIGCESGGCSIRKGDCPLPSGASFFKDEFCNTSGVDECKTAFDAPGCCVISAGNCNENQVLSPSCDADGGIAWFFDTDCSEVPECAPPTQPPVANVPTLSGWGLISLAVVLGILGIVGFMVIRRRKVTV